MASRQHSAFASVSNCKCHNSHLFSVSSRKLTLYSQSVIRSTSTRLLICCVSVSSMGCSSFAVSQLNFPLPAICNCVSVVSSVQSSKLRFSGTHIHWQPLSTAHILIGSAISDLSRWRTACAGCWISSHSAGSGLSSETEANVEQI